MPAVSLSSSLLFPRGRSCRKSERKHLSFPARASGAYPLSVHKPTPSLSANENVQPFSVFVLSLRKRFARRRAERRCLRSSRLSDAARTRERGTLRALYQGAIAEFRGSFRQRRLELLFLVTSRCFKEPRHSAASSRLDSSPRLSRSVFLRSFSLEESSGRGPRSPSTLLPQRFLRSTKCHSSHHEALPCRRSSFRLRFLSLSPASPAEVDALLGGDNKERPQKPQRFARAFSWLLPSFCSRVPRCRYTPKKER